MTYRGGREEHPQDDPDQAGSDQNQADSLAGLAVVRPWMRW